MKMSNQYQIFISYRRDGAENLSRLIEERLERMGYTVFLDVESLKEGAFDEALYKYIDQCKDVVVVLPPHGLDRCDSPDDWVRKEIAYSLQKGKHIIPFMMRNFEFPENLPEEIAAISKRNAIHESHEYFDKTIEKLVSFLHSIPVHGNVSNEKLMEAAENGDAKAMNDLALRYELGMEEGICHQRALYWYQRAVDSEYPAALFNLADIYEQCSHDITKISEYAIKVNPDIDTVGELQKELWEFAKKLYCKASNLGFKPASFLLGNMADEKHDYEKALSYYHKADPYPPALNALGYYYQNGISVPANPLRAENYFKRAANKGYAPSIYNYARILENKDVENSIRLYRTIAFGERAIPEASYCLGRLYENRGEYIQAAYYYRTAIENGISEAEQAMKRCQEHSLEKRESIL